MTLNVGRTIGIFDSGVGGLSVLHHIRAALPDERLIYVADSAHVPYGDKSPSYIEARSFTLSGRGKFAKSFQHPHRRHGTRRQARGRR
jgi:glutamate racemase